MAGLYIHIPFCARKCAYCDFISFEGNEGEQAYIEAVIKELHSYQKENIESVFIGGGTPSYISSEGIFRLMQEISSYFYINKDAEISIECNPSGLTEQKLTVYKSAGINRLSIGLQSAIDRELKLLGRLHDFDRFLQAYTQAREHFDNINIDLISSLPGQTCEDFMFSLDKVASLSPEHVSVYSLIIDEHTPLGKRVSFGELIPLSDEEDRNIYHQTGAYLQKCGYSRYEVSNYAKLGKECKHNLNYWLSGDYIGLGCAAHSCYQDKRYHNSESLNEYIQAPQDKFEIQKLNKQDRIIECIMLELRLINGIDRQRFRQRFGTDITAMYPETVSELVQMGLINLTEQSLSLTQRGLDIADAVTLKFM